MIEILNFLGKFTSFALCFYCLSNMNDKDNAYMAIIIMVISILFYFKK
jgi:hypothetical protein